MINYESDRSVIDACPLLLLIDHACCFCKNFLHPATNCLFKD